jgi:hypothetical protein
MRFRLRASKAELAGVPRDAPGGMVRSQRSKSLGNGGVIQPFDYGSRLAEDCIAALRPDKLDRARAIFPDMGNQSEGVSG